MKLLPVLVHDIGFILRPEVCHIWPLMTSMVNDLKLSEYGSLTSLVNNKHGYDVLCNCFYIPQSIGTN